MNLIPMQMALPLAKKTPFKSKKGFKRLSESDVLLIHQAGSLGSPEVNAKKAEAKTLPKC